MTSTGRSHADDAGFTLIEVLIAMLVLGILLPAVVATLYMGIKTTDETNQRLLDSHDIQTAAAFVGSDVENATSVSTSDSTTCVSPSFTLATPVLTLQWTDSSNTSGTTTTHAVNYYVSGTALIRSSCTGSAAPSALPVIHALDTSVTPDVLCQPTATPCSAVPPPSGIALRGKTANSGQMFSLIGTRRVS